MQLRQVYMRGLGSSSNRPGPGSSCLRAPNSTRGLSSGVRADAIQIAGKLFHTALWLLLLCAVARVQLWPTLTPWLLTALFKTTNLCVCTLPTEHAAYISEVAVMPCPKRLPTLLKVPHTRLKHLQLGSTSAVSAAANTVQQRRLCMQRLRMHTASWAKGRLLSLWGNASPAAAGVAAAGAGG